MAAYVDFEFYVNTFGGVAIPESDFESSATRASRELDRITQYRIKSDLNPNGTYIVDNKVKNATCAIAEILFNQSKGDNADGSILSESVGQHSVTYNVVKAEDARRVFDKTIRSAARGFLTGTGLLYVGISGC